MKRFIVTWSVLVLAACQGDSSTLLGPEPVQDELAIQPMFSTVVGAGLLSYDDRAEFDLATASAGMSYEDFEDGSITAGEPLEPCGSGPLDASVSTNACFAAGDIAAGVTFSALTGTGAEDGAWSLYGPLFPSGPASQYLVASGFDQHAYAVDFSPAVQFAALDVLQPEVLPPPPPPPGFPPIPGPPPSTHVCTVDVYGVSGLLLYSDTPFDCSATGSFFGMSSADDPIARIVVTGPTGAPPFGEVAPGLDNVAFGNPIAGNDPENKDQCKKGGWQDFGFKNQGQCIRFVNTGKDSR